MGPQLAAGGMQALLGSIVADPDTAVERLSIVEASERSILLDTFNATDLAPGDLLHAEQTVHGLLEHWARVTPDKPAAIFEVRLPSCCAISMHKKIKAPRVFGHASSRALQAIALAQTSVASFFSNAEPLRLQCRSALSPEV